MFRRVARVVVDSVRDSGEVKFHDVDNGSQDSIDHWSQLRYLSPSLVQLPPHCLTVRLNSVPPSNTETVKIIYLGDRKGEETT